ncbi:AOC03_06830 family ribosome hibernation factor [Thermocoleostomius sinensis]|jgi:hypothetical protein|uniref:Chemotaxis protein n=1 Tax=Thermocoleostomius sinensis A174 TaxID=2016057 RepID=A0A9E8ZIF6_9CYAN|nr:hypothetical protein [Thermocoleostomius sinensis]WAL62369.1 hypothetical protein OXH18_10380 [Thermocoleostomius sinensis A174]
MNYNDVKFLQSIQSYPAVSILLSTHRTAPENQQDPIRVKNLVDEAKERLQQNFSNRELSPVLKQLEQAVESIDYPHTLDGLAIFANHELHRVYYHPFPFRDRVIVDETFATRDLVFALNRTPRYWVLSLSEQSTSLFSGILDELEEVRNPDFPLTHGGPGGGSKLPGGEGINTSAYRDDHHRQFFRKADEALKPFMATDPLPLVLVGIDRYFSFFNEVSEHKDAIIATLSGNYDKTSAHDLGKLVYPLVQEALAEQRQQALEKLENAVGAQLCASGIEQAWRAAQEGRGELLLVNAEFHYPARVDQSGMKLIATDDLDDIEVMDDAVDELIESVMAKGGKVVFVDDDKTLADHQQVALILRY